jgi:hypothetical protein
VSVSDSPRVTAGSSFGSHGVGDPVGACVGSDDVGDVVGAVVGDDVVGSKDGIALVGADVGLDVDGD